MQMPIEISYKNVKKTPELDALIHRKVAKLEKLCNYLISCRVAIELPQKYPDTANPYQIRIDLKFPPAHEIIAKQTASEGDMHDPLEVVITKTFRAAERQLKDMTKRQHGEVKRHPQSQVMGFIEQLYPDRGYGFIKTVDTQDDIYFHQNSVLHHHFEKLAIGTGVRFAAEVGEKGLQASTVEIVEQPKARIRTAG